ncbi:hypothetical protein FB45DRAFT_851369 [Roridomyces roridus]|uniref:BTB domain-containing protein n=1 Tax=Roridomyces roridus TaxID=1738132 RepID=A0AAD7AYA2_9AGAR|nr:hypothetical protein FB45DRAFT_851369 [Roridomyces roridus]
MLSDTDIHASIHRIHDLWFDDGNIVLQAANCQFRVHRGILAACSPVFKDMLSFPQPADVELVEGCPLVRLTDHPKEVTVFLKAIFKPDYFMPFPAHTDYAIISGCLRLGHKYDVEHLRLRALVHLSSAFRTTLSEWDTAEYFNPGVGKETPPSACALSQIISWNSQGTDTQISCIQLAREVNALWILPAAFYSLSTSLIHPMSLMPVFNGTVCRGVNVNLAAQDLEAFLDGHSQQTLVSAVRFLGSLSEPGDSSPACDGPAGCSIGRLSAIHSLRDLIALQPSAPLELWSNWEGFDEEVCYPCRDSLEDAHEQMRKSFWDGLPEMYGLPSWRQLEQMRDAAIGSHWFVPAAES